MEALSNDRLREIEKTNWMVSNEEVNALARELLALRFAYDQQEATRNVALAPQKSGMDRCEIALDGGCRQQVAGLAMVGIYVKAVCDEHLEQFGLRTSEIRAQWFKMIAATMRDRGIKGPDGE